MADHRTQTLALFSASASASKSIRPFRSSEAYLYAMKEDLAEWLNALYDLELRAENFMEALETGAELCRHANNVNRVAREFAEDANDAAILRLPRQEVPFQPRNVPPGSFVARDNVSNFIRWCRRDLGVAEALMFETNDLVLRRNEKNVVLCLLEVARKGAAFGMPAPVLVQMERDIDGELRDGVGEVQEAAATDTAATAATAASDTNRRTMALCDLKNLDELVREILGHCTCPSQFPMVKISEGKYKVGDSNALIFVRVLRSHVMVRVGGGWDTLEHYLDKHDPCRCASLSHRLTQTRGLGFSPQKMAAPGSQPSSPSVQRRSGGDAGHSKGLRPGAPVKGHGRDSTPPRHVSGATTIPEHDAVSSRSGAAGQRSSASPSRGSGTACESRTLNSLSSLRPRRLSADSDSSASSAQSANLGRGRNEDAILAQRTHPGRRVSEGSVSRSRNKTPDARRSHSRERSLTPRPSPGTRRRGAADDRGRDRNPVLVIHRGKDGQHSLARAEDPKNDVSVQDLRDFRPPPLRLDPSQEQRLFRRLEEEFLANAKMMAEEEEEEEETVQSLGRRGVTQTAPDAGAADSAYCSSSSSSSSLNFFTKYGFQEERGRLSENAAVANGSEDAPRPKPRPQAKPRTDSQPDKTPSKIPTPRGYKAAMAADGRDGWTDAAAGRK